MSSHVKAVTSSCPARRDREPFIRAGRGQGPGFLVGAVPSRRDRDQRQGDVGIGVLPIDGADAEALLKHADAAMYAVKGNGATDMPIPRPRSDGGRAEVTAPEVPAELDDRPRRAGSGEQGPARLVSSPS